MLAPKDCPFGVNSDKSKEASSPPQAMKAFLRWCVRVWEYSGVGGYWLGGFETFVAVVLGIEKSFLFGLSALISIRIARAVVGYLDLNHLHALAYKNEWLSKKAPTFTKRLD